LSCDIYWGLPENFAQAATPIMRFLLVGQQRAIPWPLTEFAVGDHILVETMPGVGKTTLDKAFACSMVYP